MPKRSLSLPLLMVLLAACAIEPKSSNALPIYAAKGIRNVGSGSFLLDFLAIKTGTEDRAVLEYNIEKVGRLVKRVVLKIPVVDLDEGGDTGIIEVFAFEGGREIKTNDFYAGKRIARVEAPDDESIRVDVTVAVKQAVNAGRRFIGFRLSTETTDRYFLGDIVNLHDPSLRSRYGSGD
jgi:hypothetical protein